MSIRSGQAITKVFTTRRFDTGAATNGDSTPTGTLYVNGTADAASVTVTNITTGVYKAAVTLPTLALSDIVDLRISATVNSVTDNAVIWSDTKDFFAGAVPDVVAGGSGGLFIAGSNAATTISGLTTGALSCTTITASGAVAFQSTFAVTTSTSLGALSCTTLTASGAVALQSTLTVTGAVLFSSTFATTGTTTFNALTVTNNFLVSGNATVTGTTTHTGAVTASNTSNSITGIEVVKVGPAGSGVAQTAGDIYAAVTNIGVTTAALNAIAASAVYTTGTDSGGVANTNTLDGVYDSVTDTAGTVDFYYQFSLGSTGQTAVGVNWIGYVVGVVNTVKVYAYNWGGATWDQVGNIVGIAGAINSTQDWELTSAHTGTGGNLGLVRIRFNATGLTASTTKTDRILCGYVYVQAFPTNFSSLAITAGGIAQADVQTIKTNPVINAGTVTFPTDATLASTTNITAGTITTVTTVTNQLTAAAIATGVWQDTTAGDFTTSSSIGKSLYNAFTANTSIFTVAALANAPGLDASGVRSAVGLASANLDMQLAEIEAETDLASTLMTTQLTESYNADGVAPTPAQALMVIMQMLTELSFASTTGTVKKLDGSTTALTLTIDNAVTPTSITRAT